MVEPFDERLQRIQNMNPRDDQVEGHLLYKKRIFELTEKELLAIARNPWTKMADKAEALCQILEYCRVKSY